MDIKYGTALAVELTLVVFCQCKGGDCPSFEWLNRPYCRTNTWNGCCTFENGLNTRFWNWKPPRQEVVSAIYAARHYVRYGKRVSAPAGYYEDPVDDALCVANAWKLSLDQFPPQSADVIVLNGISIPMSDMNVRVLPFKVTNPKSKSPLHCILVAFVHKGSFCLAVYVNVNDGRASLDFHDVAIGGYAFIAHESRYPYLTSSECDIQRDVYVKLFSRLEKKREEMPREGNSESESNKCVPAKPVFDINTDVEVSI